MLPVGMLLGEWGAVPTMAVVHRVCFCDHTQLVHAPWGHPCSSLLPLQGYGTAKGAWGKSLSIWGFNWGLAARQERVTTILQLPNISQGMQE